VNRLPTLLVDRTPPTERSNPTPAAGVFASLRGPEALLWALVACGGLLRIVRYFDNRSFWLDESMLGLNLLDRSAAELRSTLDYVQSAPYGFLLAQKAVIAALGDSELALRLVPLLSSLAALGVFALIARRLLAPVAAVVAVSLMVFGEPFLYQSSEAKPYSTDVLVSLVVVWLTLRVDTAAPRREFLSSALLLAGAGALGVWFSYPSVFVLAAAFASLIVRLLLRRRLTRAAALFAAGGTVAAVFLLSYSASASSISTVNARVFAGHPSVGTEAWTTMRLAWFAFSDPGGFWYPVRLVVVVCLAVGLVSFAREAVDRLVLLAGPAVLAVFAAFLSKYPLGGRFSLFFAPLVFVIVARGAFTIWDRWRWRVAIAVPIVLALVGPQVVQSAVHIADPPRREHVRPLLHTLKREWRSGDTLFVYQNAQFALRWYDECRDCGVRPLPFGLRAAPRGATSSDGSPAALVSSPPSVVVGRNTLTEAEAARTVSALEGRSRVWLLFSHVAGGHGDRDAEQLMIRALDGAGRRLDAWYEDDASLYLYDLS
jgi:Dolichyl-phosphate-mannose-protein mannosyltransferase